uniref:hypothetical protein n=1 Tax=Candidatus Magnetaquicoccus inordinatus TaxID=2496818 RepID=UPI00187D3170
TQALQGRMQEQGLLLQRMLPLARSLGQHIHLLQQDLDRFGGVEVSAGSGEASDTEEEQDFINDEEYLRR